MGVFARGQIRNIRYPILVLLLLVSALTPGWRVSSQAAQTIGGYQLVSEEPQKGSISLFTYRATLTNSGGALASATATATSLSTKTKIVDGSLTFGPVGPGAAITSTDTFSLSRNTKQRFDFADIVWTITAVPNHPPVADAGADLTRRVGQTAQLDGSASTDPDGNQLTHRWTLASIPAGSAATLSDPSAVKPTFVVDRPGTYVVSLVVNDGFVDSAADAVTISTVNSAPVADAGPDQTKTLQQTVTLNGSGSSDVDGDALTFAWSLVSRPDDSTAVLSEPTSVAPTFQIDRPGTYVVSLVVHDGVLFSDPDTVSITTVNSPPVANAGPDQSAFVTNTVMLDGSGSTDVDGDQLSYTWALTSVPAGSAAALNDPAVPRPTFVLDRPGIYVAQLVVHDGTVSSEPDTVTITTENSAPVANAGPGQTVVAGRAAFLDGSASSDVDGDRLTFTWSFTSVPEGSAATLSDAASPTPSFVVDRVGLFVVQLIVNDGFVDSSPVTVTITTTNSPPVAKAGADQFDVLVFTVVALDGTQSADADEHPLTYSWSLLSRPATSSAALAGANTATPSLTPDVPGDYVAQLIVNDGFADSDPDTVLVHAVPIPVVTVETLDHAAEPFLVPGRVRFTRDETARAVVVSFTIGGTAVNGVDYQLLNATAAFAAGQATVDLAIAPLDDLFVEGPETVEITLLPGMEYAVGDASTAVVSIADKPLVDLALVDSTLVGVGIPAPLLVTLEAPAPPGGVTVTVTSDDPTRLEVAAPGSATIPEGETVGQVILNGLAPSTVTIRASAPHYQKATLAVTVVRNIISLPSALNVPFGHSANLPITIERDAGNQGDILVVLVSDNPAVISVTTPTLTIPAGELSANATVVGEGVGSATLKAMATNFVSDTGVGTVSAALDITAPTLTINSVAGGPFTVELESPPGSPVAAPAGGILVSVSAANTACVSVPATATILSGVTSVAVNATYGGSAALPCTTTVTASGPTGFTSDTISITVNTAPAITVPLSLGSIGGGLQAGAFSATLSAVQQSVLRVHIASSDPARVLVARDAATAGAGAIDIDVPAGQSALNFHVQGVDWVDGTSSAAAVTVTFSAPGFNGDTTTVNYVQPAVDLVNLPAAPSAASPNSDFIARVGIPATNNTAVTLVQSRRAGVAPLTVTVTNSATAVAEIDLNGGGDGEQLQTATIAPGVATTPNNAAGGLEFDPRGAGTTVVTATIPGFITTTAGAKSVTVAPSPAITLPGVLPVIGGGLQAGGFSATLGAPPQTDLIVKLVSSDPSRVLLAPNTTAAGLASLDIAVPAGQTALTFHVQGTDWIPDTSSAATVTITASADGYIDDSTTIGYVQPAVGINALPANTTTLSASSAFTVRVGIAGAGNLNITALQTRRPANEQERQLGIVPDLTVTVTNSNASIAQIEKILDAEGNVSVAQSQTTTIPVGAFNSPNQTIGGLRFDPIDAGDTVVTATIPGFIITAAAKPTVTVTATAGITFPAFFGALGGGLQNGAFSGTLGASQHGGVTVRLTSSDPSRVLLAPNSTTPGTAALQFVLANGQTAFTYYLQGADWVSGTSSAATVTITASATGFTPATGTVNYVQPAVDLTLPTTTTDLSANTDFAVRVGIPSASNGAVTALQPRRAGAPALVATVTNSDETVAEIDQNGGVNGAQQQTTTIVPGQSSGTGLEFDPLSTGTTVVTATIPGFITTLGGARTITVSTPTITVPALLGSVGGGLQMGAFSVTLGGSQHGGVRVHMASSDPSRVLLAPNATTAGLAAIDVDLPNGQTAFSFYVQGTDWIAGTSSAATVTLTVSAPGFITDTSSINYVQPALDIPALPATLAAGAANVAFSVRIGLPSATNTLVTSLQARRAGAPALVATVTNSDGTVAEIDLNGGLNGAQSQTAAIAAGQTATPLNLVGGLEFDPQAAGTTVVTATIPGFITTINGARTVTITP